MKLAHYKKIVLMATWVALLTSCSSSPKYDSAKAESDLARVATIERKAGRQLVIRLNREPMFETRSSILKPEVHSDVAALAHYLNNTNYEFVDIEGYADSNEGEASFNQELARQRAYSMRSALYLQGVDPGRMTARGEGEKYPEGSTATAEGRSARKRTEALLLIR